MTKNFHYMKKMDSERKMGSTTNAGMTGSWFCSCGVALYPREMENVVGLLKLATEP